MAYSEKLSDILVLEKSLFHKKANIDFALA